MGSGKKEAFQSISEEKRYTVDDIRSLPEGARTELIDGEMFPMTPPGTRHQDVLMWLADAIYSHIRAHHREYRVHVAPLGVYVKEDGRNYLEPDIVVNCDRSRLREDGCHGAPDMVIEIISPASGEMDRVRKLDLYRETGVREYWIVDPGKETITVHDLGPGFAPALYDFTDWITSSVMMDMRLNLAELKVYLDWKNPPEIPS